MRPSRVPSTEKLLQYVAEGLLTRVDLGSLSIFNYTKRVAYDSLWDEVTLNARGLVLDMETDEVAALAFPKFFNDDEPLGTIPARPPDSVTTKLDGALGISFWHEGRLRWTTRGSFYSPHAEAANALWNHAKDWLVPERYTLLVEIIHPVTRIVVPYDFEGLVLLGVIDRTTGRDLPYDEVCKAAWVLDLRVTEAVDATDAEAVRAIADAQDHRAEGFVARWGDHRVKIKGARYREVHRLVMGCNERRVTESWASGDMGWFVALPEEHRAFAEGVVADLDAEAASLKAEGATLLREVEGMTRKEAVEHIGVKHRAFPVVMSHLSGREPDVRALVAKGRLRGER